MKNLKERLLNESWNRDEQEKFINNAELYDSTQSIKFGTNGFAVFNSKGELIYFGEAEGAYNLVVHPNYYSTGNNEKLTYKRVEVK